MRGAEEGHVASEVVLEEVEFGEEEEGWGWVSGSVGTRVVRVLTG